MNPLLAWGNQLKLGLPVIDRQHRELIRLANLLYVGMKAGQGREVLSQLFIDLANYTVWHFATEESLMTEHDYPHAEAHLQEHATLKQAVAELSERAKDGRLEITLETMNFLRDWLCHHIQHTDKELVKFIQDNSGKAPPRKPRLRLVVSN